MTIKVTAIWVIIGLAIGLLCLLLFNCCGQPLNLGTAFVWALAYFVLGGLAGFIFGVPKIVANTNPNANINEPAARNILQENTNLTQISDWLTKVIIGAGLVELKQIPPFIVQVARKMARGLDAGPFKQEHLDYLSVLSGGIIIYFITWGFVSGYLVMRLVIAKLLPEDL